jgi:hypothetical protein
MGCRFFLSHSSCAFEKSYFALLLLWFLGAFK